MSSYDEHKQFPLLLIDKNYHNIDNKKFCKENGIKMTLVMKAC
jgi:hypothetical protein